MDWKNRYLSRLAHLSPHETGFFIRIADLAKQRGMELPDFSPRSFTRTDFVKQRKISESTGSIANLNMNFTSYLKCLRLIGHRESCSKARNE